MTDAVLMRLAETIAARAASGSSAESYTARLLVGGAPLAARKFGEEAVEATIAALSGADDALVSEAADVLYHLIVLLRTRGIGIAPVLAELAAREGRSGIAEKNARTAP